MKADHAKEIETIVNTLLQVGHRVVEIAKDHTMTRIWDHGTAPIDNGKDYEGKKIIEIRNGDIIIRCDEKINEVFKTGVSSCFQYTTIKNEVPTAFEVRILPVHPDKEFLFLTVERLPAKEEIVLTEDKWKLALDAAGDGMWDINMETDKIFFSEKWHELFGYAVNEITTGAEWSAKIHPDDLQVAAEKRDEYLSGKTPSYSAEVRHLCKDGTYRWILSRGVAAAKTEDGKLLRFVGTHTDIHDRKIAEEKYASTAQLLSKLINNLQNGILVTDEYQNIVFANDMFCELYGINIPPEDLIGMDYNKSLEIRKVFYEYPEEFVTRIKSVVKRQEIVLNDQLKMKDGRILSRDYLPLTLGKNNKGAIWKFKDVTVQKNIEQQLEEQRKFYESILDNIPADIAIFDGQHKYLFVNRHAFKNEELRKWMIGKTDIDYASYSNRPESFYMMRFAMYDKAIEGRTKTENIERLINKEGKEEHHLRILHPVFYDNGSLEFLMGYGLDVTELITAQNALKTSSDTFTSAFSHSGVGIALLNPDGTWLDVNGVLCGLTGYTKDELMQMTYHDITYHEDVEIDRPLISQIVNREITTYTIEKRFVSKAKKIVLVSLTVSLVWDLGNTPKFFIAQVIDISQQKEMEMEIRHKNAELEITRENLIGKIAQLEELGHIIAHNLRGPAGNIKILTEALLHKITGKPEEQNALSNSLTQEQGLEFIGESSDQLIGSLSTLMKIAEIQLNKSIPYNNCDVSKVINDITSQLHSTIFQKLAVIKQELDVKTISYPQAYLEHVLYNFISNALKYCKDDVVPEITIATRIVDDRVQIIVKDNGLGIDMEKHGNSVFKLNQVFHTGYDSKGVGLYITKNQVESLGGTITVNSKPGEGSEFIVTI